MKITCSSSPAIAKVHLPITPPPLRNHGNYIISLNKFVRWLGEQVEQSGVDVFAGFAGAELLMEGDRVVGIRTGDKGVDKDGKPKGNYEPGIDIRAKVTILAEGARGSLTKQLIQKLRSRPGTQSAGLCRRREGSLGRPEAEDAPAAGSFTRWAGRCATKSSAAASSTTWRTAGFRSASSSGSTIPIPASIRTSAFSSSRRILSSRSLLEGGTLHSYGAKAIPEGGYWAQPQYYFNGGLIIGDSAGFLNSMRLKGIHLAIQERHARRGDCR